MVRLCTVMFCCACLAAQQPDRSLDWRAALDWLPTDTQTLIVASQPFVIPKDSDDAGSEPSPVDLLRQRVLGGLEDFPALYQSLAGQRVKFALSGTREFRNFSGLGMVPYDGCAVIVLSEALGTGFSSAVSTLPKEDWSGATIFSLSTVRNGSLRASPEQLNLFVTRIGSNVLVSATDRESLHSLLERRAGPRRGRAMPRALPEWKEVDNTAPVWAVRHFKHVYDRRTGRFALSLGPMEELDDSEAEGVVYNARPSGSAQKVYYLSHNPRITELTRQRWTWVEEGLAPPKVHRKAAGLVEVTIPTPSPHATTSFALLLMASLGYTIAL